MKPEFGRLSSSLAVFSLAAAVPLAADAHKFKADLDGFEEVPSLSTPAQGWFRASYDRKTATITYELRYEDVNPTQAHIHFGQRGVAGGVSAFLCTNLGNGPAVTPACPPGPATVTGMIQAAQIVGPAGQGINAGDFDKLVEALREGVAYANVHSTQYPGGEIRGQIKD